jgi:MFS family permease
MSSTPRKVVQILAISALGSCAGAGLVLVGAARDALVLGYQTTLSTLAWLTTGLTVTYALMQFPAGSLVDRWGPRRVGYLGATGILVFYGIAMFTPNFALALVARVLAGTVTALCFVAGSDLVRALGMPAWVQGLFGGLALGTGGVAFLVLPGLGAGPIGWRAPWLFELLLAVIALVGLLSVPPTRPRPASPSTPTRIRQIASRRLLAIAAAHAATFALGVVLSNWLAVQLIRDGGISQGWANAISAALLMVTAISRPIGGYLFDRNHDLRLIVVLPLAGGAGSLIALAAPLGHLWSLAAAVAFGVLSGLPFAALFELARREAPQAPGTAIGLINGLANAVILGGVPLFILLIENGQGRAGLWGMGVLWFAAMIAFLPVAARARGSSAS